MEPDISCSDEFLNRRQSVSFNIPVSISEADNGSLYGCEYDFDKVIEGTFSTSDEDMDKGETSYHSAADAVDPSLRRRSSLSSTNDLSLLALPIDNIVIGLSIVYAVVMSIVGLVIPIAEALTHSWLNSIYGAVFITYQLTVGFFFLLYLQFYHLKTGGSRRRQSISDISYRRSKGGPASRRQSLGGNTIWVDMTSFGDIFTHPETSLFLRLGTLVFSLGNLIYYGFEIASYMYKSDVCRSKYLFGWTFYLRFAFVLLQTYFLFKNTGISLFKHIHGVWFGMLHLASTNICLWLRTVVHEILEEVEVFHESKHDDANAYGVTDATIHKEFASNHSKSQDCEDELLHTLSLYLFPFILEYSLIAVGSITSLLHVMIVTKNDHGRRIQDIRNEFRVVCLQRRQSTPTDSADQQLSSVGGGGGSGSSGDQMNILGKSHRGFFVAALVVAGLVSAIIVFYLLPARKNDACLPSLIYHVTDLSLHVFLLGGCVLAFVQMRPLGFLPKTISVDDVLIVVAMCGSVMYDVAVIVASSDALSRRSPDKRVDALRLSSSLVAFVQVIVQSLFLICSLRRYPSDADHVERKPGRGALTTLVIGNAAVWVFRTILAKGSDMRTQESFYGEVPWTILMDINLPLALFFCFHSSICFADVWHRAFAPLDCINQMASSRSSSMSNVASPSSFHKTQTSPALKEPSSCSIFVVS